MKLSIVATLYQSEAHVEEFISRACSAARGLVGEDYEIVLVNDGSPDRSLVLARAALERCPQYQLIDLSRNFGHHKALMTGLQYARGAQVFLIDCDLEEDPGLLTAFSQQQVEQDCDVVFGVQALRKGAWFERWAGQLFYTLFNVLTELALPPNICTVRLMSRRYVDALLSHGEREVFLAGLWQITGFDQQPHTIIKGSKPASTYTLRRKLALFVNSVTSFSNAPLTGIFYVGVLISLLAGAYIVYLFIHWLRVDKPLSGWTSVMASIWLLGGLIISFIGVVGIYLSKIFSETKQRPYTIVRHIYRSGHEQ